MPSSLLKDAHPELVTRWIQVLTEYREGHEGHDLQVTCTFRSVEEQARLYTQGRTLPGPIVTQCDGLHTRSLHNSTPARALDFMVLVAGKPSWDTGQYEPVGALAEAAGLVWGGRWKTLKDYPHVELPKEII